jgi:hypothetical protein
MKFNINHEVKVKLTDYGRKIHKQQWDDLVNTYPSVTMKYTPPKEDRNGWSKWQLWQLMYTFGECIYNGAVLPFETTIEIIEER